MVVAAGEHETVLQQRRGGQIGIDVTGSHVDRELGLAPPHVGHDLLFGDIDHADADIGVLLGKAADHTRQHIGGDRNQRGQRDPSACDIDHVADVGIRLLELSQDLPRRRQERLPHGGQRDGPRGAVDQLGADRVFQLLQPLRQRRLRDVKIRSGLLEAAAVDDADENLYIADTVRNVH